MITPAASLLMQTTSGPAGRAVRGVAMPARGGRLATVPIALGVLLLVLSAVDAAATLVLLEAGCEEINPAMRYLLSQGVWAFLAGKLTLTAAGSFILVAFEARPLFRSPVRVGHTLAALVGLFVILIVYQANLLLAI